MDCADGPCFGKPQMDDKTDARDTSYRLVNKVVNAHMLTDINATHYNMRHTKNRGIALILNHEKFCPLKMKETRREGTDVDAKSMDRILKNLNFKVTVHNDLKLAKIQQYVSEAAKLDHAKFDCFVLVVMTHGHENDILCAQDARYSFNELWTPFSADECPTLAGKPKLFFIQACRGTQVMSAVNLIKTEADGSCPEYRIPSKADFLFAYSNIPGYLSWRNTEYGSWFIQALCQELENNAYNYDLLTLLTSVIRKVAIDHETNLPDKPEKHERKQIPSVTTSLTRLVKFNKPGEEFIY